MNYEELKKKLASLGEGESWPFEGIKLTFGESYHPQRQWFDSGNDEIPLAGYNGVYLYTSLEGDVWYIGKGRQDAGGGIGKRSCSHLGKAGREGEFLFPHHQWVGETEIDEDIILLLKKGDFHIRTIRVEPDKCSKLIEVVLQISGPREDDKWPPLNKKIG